MVDLGFGFRVYIFFILVKGLLVFILFYKMIVLKVDFVLGVLFEKLCFVFLRSSGNRRKEFFYSSSFEVWFLTEFKILGRD